MDELLQTVIAGAPNLAVALVALAWLSRLVHRLLDRIDELCDNRFSPMSAGEEEGGST